MGSHMSLTERQVHGRDGTSENPCPSEAMDKTEALAEDTLADILGRLPPRDLAASCCVRKSWHAIVDDHGLLLRHVLPRTVRGLFLNYSGHVRPHFFAGPSSTRRLPATINGDLSFLPNYGAGSKPILDHCNGLLLCKDLRTLCVVNPATRRWEDLPSWEDANCDAYIVFDPAVSLNYEVFSIPQDPEKVVLNPWEPQPIYESELDSQDESEEEEHDLSTVETRGEQEKPHDLMECPPSLWTFNVFSSITRQWQKRSFVREAEAPDTVTNMLLDPVEPRPSLLKGPKCTCSVYWPGSLYVNFHGAFVARLSSANGKYLIIKTPVDIGECKHVRPYIGKSEYGVYFATMSDRYRLQVWTLMESSELEPCTSIGLRQLVILERFGKTWILDDDNNVDGNYRRVMRTNFDWDSDDDNVVNMEDAHESFCRYVSFLGFHPYKEVVYLGLASSIAVGVAYHLNSSKVQYLGRLPKDFSYGICGSFPYTPCMTGHLVKHFRE